MEILANFFNMLSQGDLNTVIDRIQTGNGFLITVIGLLAVFSGLLLLWAITANLPNLINTLQTSPKKAIKKIEQKEKEGQTWLQKEPENIAVAIGVALCCELEEEEISVITLRNIEQDMSPWVMAARQSTMRQT